MNYELAKQLKEAGLELNPNNGNNVYINSEFTRYPYSLSAKDEILYIPTLEELIEACGDDFEYLELMNEPEIGEWWRAYPTEDTYYKKMKGECYIGCCGYETGDTPSEAVARLWLELNE